MLEYFIHTFKRYQTAQFSLLEKYGKLKRRVRTFEYVNEAQSELLRILKSLIYAFSAIAFRNPEYLKKPIALTRF
jgi:hypothetical protein